MVEFQAVKEETAKNLCHGKIWSVLTKSPNFTILKTQMSGFVSHIDALVIGKACVNLGAGRSSKSSEIDTSVGIEILKGVGEKILENEGWIKIYHKESTAPAEILLSLESAIEIVEKKTFEISKITKIIGKPKSACLHFYTAKTQAALALTFLPYSTLRVEQCFDSGSL